MKRTNKECWIENDICHVQLSRNKEAICDKEFCFEVNKYSWNLGRNGYVSAWINNKRIYIHRFLFTLKYKEDIGKNTIDHVNHNPLDNRITNLRIATCSQNSMNRKIKGNFKGVSFNNEKQKYVAQIYINKKQFCLGHFNDEKSCAIMYDVYAFHYFGQFAVLNFPSNIEIYKREKPILGTYKELKAYSKFTGVCFHKRKNKFQARLTLNSKRVTIGYFDDEISAAKSVDVFIIKNNLNKKLNFPKESYEQELNQEPKQMVLFKAS